MLCACVCCELHSLYRMDTFTDVAAYQYARAIFIACIDFTMLLLIYNSYACFYNCIRQFYNSHHANAIRLKLSIFIYFLFRAL